MNSLGTVPIFAARTAPPYKQAPSPRKWDCPLCAAKGDRSMFSANDWLVNATPFGRKMDQSPAGDVPRRAIHEVS